MHDDVREAWTRVDCSRQHHDAYTSLHLQAWASIISGFILFEETLYQSATKEGKTFAGDARRPGIVPGIKVDKARAPDQP
jgi:fructose-bisphosphate aldolase class 1